MAITTDQNYIIYTCDSAVTVYNFSFYTLKTEDIQVTVYDSNGVSTLLTEGTDYSVALNGESGGSITLTTAYDNTYTLLIYRQTDYTQETRYTEGDPFPAQEHEKALDKLTMETQQLNEKVERALLADIVNHSLDFKGKVIHNIGDAVESQDAIAKGQLLDEIKNIDGAGSGVDADLLDGQEGSYYADTGLSNVADSTILAKVKNVDGAGSGLDADTIDGKDSTDLIIKDSTDGKYDANNTPIKNVPNPVNGQDVCNYQTVINATSGSVSIHALDEKTVTDQNDEIVVADSDDNFVNKKVLISNMSLLPAQVGGTSTPTADKIPISDSSGKLNAWIDNITYYSVNNADFDCINKTLYLVDTSANAVTATLPSSPNNFDVVGFIDLKSTFDTNNLIIAANGNSIMGLAEDMTVDIKNISFELIYNNGDWRIK